MGGSQSSEKEPTPPPPPEEDEDNADLQGGGDHLTLKLRDDAPEEEPAEEEDDWDLELEDNDDLNLHEEPSDPSSPQNTTFKVNDSSKIVLRQKPDLSATGSDLVAAPKNGTLLKGVTYTINKQDWIQLEEPCKGFWITREGLEQR